jgi:hypothetical protein
MSDSTPENGSDDQLISDDQLPEDLQPAKNPMARDPGESLDTDESAGEEEDSTAAAGSVAGMPDLQQQPQQPG